MLSFKTFASLSTQQHGFARNMDWTLVDSENAEGSPVVTLELKDAPYSRAMWDFSFHALFKVKRLFFFNHNSSLQYYVLCSPK